MEKIYFIHGLMGISEYHFKQQIDEFKSDYEIIPLNLPGHGNNPNRAKEPFFPQALSWAQIQISEHGKGHIVGLSLGASVAIHIALQNPHLCESVVLTGYAPYVPDHMNGIMEKQYKMFLNIEDNNPEVAKEFKELHGDKWYETLKFVLKQMTFNYPSISNEQLQNLIVPTLVLNGANEEHERKAVCEIANVNKDILIGLIPNAGHTANIEQANVYNSILKSFWIDYVK